ncbi:hypothetical protein GF318_02820 [Candidatus Micrarchaeota archaeon]|nr:hypothetical protein [Candidatus Micrarchaeota archaeon]
MEWKAMPLFVLLFASLAAAAPQHFGHGGYGLEAALDNAECRAYFTIGVLESHIEHLEAQNLQDNVDDIEADVEELQDLAEDGDAEGFRDYLHNSFNLHLREARLDALDARKSGNMSQGAGRGLRDDYRDIRDDFRQCHFESIKRFGEAKVEAYRNALERAGNMSDNLESKGVDTEGLEEIIDDAEETTVDPLDSAIGDARDAEEVRNAIGQYCLFNGCRNGENFHFAAHISHEKLDSILDVLEEDAVEAGLGGEVSDVSDQLEEAFETLSDVGTSQYEGGQHDDAWDNLRDAAQGLKDILYEMRSGENE